MDKRLTVDLAEKYASLTLGNVGREYPHKLDHVMGGAGDVRGPRALHPVFYGCFDWHSCVHGYWQLARWVRLFPRLSCAGVIGARFDEAMTAEKVAVEVAYMRRAESRGFERPYGWAWLLALMTELKEACADGRERWHASLEPLAAVVVERFLEFLPKATLPVRTGMHGNSAFALTLAHEYAVVHGEKALKEMIEERVRGWFLGDVGCQAWEPSLEDFLSPALCEAVCMERVLSAVVFEGWLGAFLPGLGRGEPVALFRPVGVSDRTDGRIAHLDGLHLSRAWCFQRLAKCVAGSGRERMLRAAEEHLEAALPHLAGDYAGEHWLATFALLAMTG